MHNFEDCLRKQPVNFEKIKSSYHELNAVGDSSQPQDRVIDHSCILSVAHDSSLLYFGILSFYSFSFVHAIDRCFYDWTQNVPQKSLLLLLSVLLEDKLFLLDITQAKGPMSDLLVYVALRLKVKE